MPPPDNEKRPARCASGRPHQAASYGLDEETIPRPVAESAYVAWLRQRRRERLAEAEGGAK